MSAPKKPKTTTSKTTKTTTKAKTTKTTAKNTPVPKKPFYKQVWFWVIVGVVFLGIVVPNSSKFANLRNHNSSNSNNTNTVSDKDSEEKKKQEEEKKKQEEEERRKEEARKQEKIKNAKTVSYTDLFRNSANYKGDYIKFRGEVLQTDSINSYCRVATKKSSYSESYYENVIYLVPCTTDGTKILEDDIIDFVGIGDGTHSYTTVLNATVELPRLKAAKITLVKHLD